MLTEILNSAREYKLTPEQLIKKLNFFHCVGQCSLEGASALKRDIL